MMENIGMERNQAEIMLRLQDAINSKINSAWRDENNPWYRAVWTECAELMDHVGWKWWKSQEPDIHQMRLEVVDIWHFGLSEILAKSQGFTDAADIVSKALFSMSSINDTQSKAEILLSVEEFASETLKTKSFALSSFIELAKIVGLGASELYTSYVGKNVLNAFRQDNGYKRGSYVKVWAGKEDNVWLSEIVSRMTIDSPDFASDLYAELETIYKSNC
jgi:dimeric dUTPase (all-alpha-NTP-PPase superfamily)